MNFFSVVIIIAMEHIFERIVMKTLQRELQFDYDTNLAGSGVYPLKAMHCILSHVHRVKITQIFLSTYERTSLQT